ncbi:MAG: hypothetical protein ACE149_18060 [Armatimonadota bacterium]
MSVVAREREMVRDLAKRLAEIAALPAQAEKAELWRRLNRLEPVRPMVWLRMAEDSAWPDTGIGETLECGDPFLRREELELRRLLYQWEHQRADMVFEAVSYVPLAIRDSGFGIEVKADRPDHWFGASRYLASIESEEDIEKIQRPQVSVDWEETERRHQQHCELYDGVLEVRKVGRRDFWFSIFDTYIQWRGVEQAFLDMSDRPEWLHRVMDRMTEGHLAEIEGLEREGALSLNNGNVRVGSQGLGFTDELPQSDFDGEHVGIADLWGHASTQIFADVSPAMHEEFALQYEARLLKRFGLSSYGCCEPLHRKVGIVRKHLPNLRMISMSPWVDVEMGAAAVGKELVFAYKPNPAIMAGESWDIDQVRAELRSVLERTRGCSVAILMKDLHTCNGHPERMWQWTRAAVELAEEFAS